jgi:hypothetical protein
MCQKIVVAWGVAEFRPDFSCSSSWRCHGTGAWSGVGYGFVLRVEAKHNFLNTGVVWWRLNSMMASRVFIISFDCSACSTVPVVAGSQVALGFCLV